MTTEEILHLKEENEHLRVYDQIIKTRKENEKLENELVNLINKIKKNLNSNSPENSDL